MRRAGAHVKPTQTLLGKNLQSWVHLQPEVHMGSTHLKEPTVTSEVFPTTMSACSRLIQDLGCCRHPGIFFHRFGSRFFRLFPNTGSGMFIMPLLPHDRVCLSICAQLMCAQTPSCAMSPRTSTLCVTTYDAQPECTSITNLGPNIYGDLYHQWRWYPGPFTSNISDQPTQ